MFIKQVMTSQLQFDQTLSALQERVKFFATHHTSAQNNLNYTSNASTIRSLAEIYPQLKTYSLYDTPLDPQLSQIYSSTGQDIRFLLPPPSEGQNSINEQQGFDPTFKWLSSSLIDSTLLFTDQIEPRKVQKGGVPADWGNVTSLLLSNIKQKIYLKSQINEIDVYLHQRFDKFPWVKIKRIKQLYVKGKSCILLRFADVNATCFAHFNLIKGINTLREFFGDSTDVYRVVEDRLKSKHQKWVAIIFRKIPINLNKEAFISMLKKNDLPIVWLQDLVTIADYKYTLCRVNYLQDAISLCNYFQTKKPIKDMKVNLHPKSSKIWKNSQQSPEAAITNT